MEITHELKILPKYFEEILSKNKQFELRKNDRGFAVGDYIWLREYLNGSYTGREMFKTVSYMLENADEFGLKEGYCILSFKS